jgi:hypothetical protein
MCAEAKAAQIIIIIIINKPACKRTIELRPIDISRLLTTCDSQEK